jgi:hypothetical protein
MAAPLLNSQEPGTPCSVFTFLIPKQFKVLFRSPSTDRVNLRARLIES